MGDGDPEDLALRRRPGEVRPGVLDADMDEFAEELELLVPEHGPGEEPELEEDLEAVADAQNVPAAAGEGLDLLHQGREPGDGPGAQVVPVGKASGQDDASTPREVMVLVPEEDRLPPQDVLEDVEVSRSQFDPGNMTTPNFMGSPLIPRRSARCIFR